MDYTRLAELKNIQLSKEIKHELNKKEQFEYAEEIFKALKEKGVTEDLAYYIITMARYGGVEGFVRWYTTVQKDEQVAAIEALTADEVLNKLGPNALRFLLYLLASIISLKPENSIVNAHLFLLLVYYSYKKDGTRVSDLGSIFKSSFANTLKPYANLPIFSKYPFPDNYTFELIQMLEEAVDQMPAKKEKELLKKDELRKWIKTNKYYITQDITSNPNSVKESTMNDISAETTITDYTGTSSEKAKTEEYKDSHDDLKAEINEPETKLTGAYAMRLFEIAKAIDLLETEIDILRDKVDQKDKSIKSLTMKLNMSEEDHIRDTGKIAELEECLKQAKEELNNTVNEKKDLEDRISRQGSVLAVFQEDKANSQSQQLNSIAAALSRYHKSYERVKDEEIQSETELFLMDLLEDIFKTLKRNGVDVQGSIA